MSSEKFLSAGIPQYSKLYPLLFLLFINAIADNRKGKVHLFRIFITKTRLFKYIENFTT